jgi:hypothetical protein
MNSATLKKNVKASSRGAVSSITLNIKTLLNALVSKQLRNTVDMCTFSECKKKGTCNIYQIHLIFLIH